MQITSVLTLALGLLSSSAFAKIALGNTREGQSVMWYYGQSACTAVNNPGNCGSAVTLNNGAKFTVKGCGGPLYLLNGDGNFDSTCQPRDPYATDCGILMTYTCG